MSRRPKQSKKHKLPGIKRFKRRFVPSIIFIVVFGICGCVLLVLTHAATSPFPIPPPDTSNLPAVAPNPTLSEACGGALDIALVADVSSSISGDPEAGFPNYLPDVQNALRDAIDSLLPGTNSEFSVTKFSTDATVIQPFTGDVTALNNAIGQVVGGGTTDWTDGLATGYGTFSGVHNNLPRLLIIATDGDPSTPLSDAVREANTIKGAGVHIVAIGLGDDPTLQNLEDLSGPNVNTGSANEDVVTTAFTSFASALLSITQTGCGVGGSGNGTGGTGNGNGTGGTGSGTGGTGNGSAGPGTSPAKPTPQPSPSPAPVAVISNQPNPAPKPTAQGTQVKPPKPQPSPFFDGKQYARGSVADTLPTAPVHHDVSAKWYIFIAVVLFLAGGGFLAGRKWLASNFTRDTLKPRTKK